MRQVWHTLESDTAGTVGCGEFRAAIVATAQGSLMPPG